MKLKHAFIFSLFLWVFWFCTVDKSNKENESNDIINLNEDADSSFKEIKDDNIGLPHKGKNKLHNFKLSDINLDSIKNIFLDNEYYTSGVLSKKSTEFFEPINEDYFYGFYFFIEKNEDEKSPFPYTAKAVVKVKNSEKWNYNDGSEELVEFTFFSNNLNPFIDLIAIGQTKNTLTKKLGKDFLEEKSNIIYFYENNYVFSFLINNDLITGIRVGQYKDKTHAPIITPQ